MCKPKKEGELGFRPLKQMTQALLAKLLSSSKEDRDSLGKQILVTKYDLNRNGWDVQGLSYHHIQAYGRA